MKSIITMSYVLKSLNQKNLELIKIIEKKRLLNKYNDYILQKIPFKIDYYAKLNEFHSQKSHCNYKRLVR